MSNKKVYLTNSFKRDIKKKTTELATPQWIEVMYCLINHLPLPIKYCDHSLNGQLNHLRDCHIKPDLILLYEYDQNNHIILHRLGSHSELNL